jgi:hypothetical protein
MAKKKTKVGSAISKVAKGISSAVKQATNKVKQSIDKSQVNKGGLAASVSGAFAKAGIGKSTTVSPSAAKATAVKTSSTPTISAPKKANVLAGTPSALKIKTSSTSGESNYPGLVGNVPTGITFGGQPFDLNKAISSGGLSVGSSPTTTLEKEEAPTSADVVMRSASVPSVNMSGSTSSSPSVAAMGIGSTASAGAATAGVQTRAEQMLAEQNQFQQQMLEAEKERKNILDQLFKQEKQLPTREELRQEYEDAYKIQEQTAEINSLEQDLDKVLNEISNQEAVARDRLGTNDFINNQIAQIRRNSEPIVNRLSSEIKWRSGLLAQDKALMNEAISDALADNRSRVESARWFANEYLGYLDEKHKRAYEEYMRDEERAYDEKQSFLEYARDVAWEYAQNGIRVNINPYTITPDELAEKIARNPLPQSSSRSSGTETTSAFNDIIQMNIDAGLSPETAAREAAAYAEQIGIQVDQRTLSSFLETARTLTPTVAPVTQTEEPRRGFFARLFNF